MKLEIERLGHRGEGIAAGPIFVTGVLPGEVVEGVPEDGRIAAPKILTPSVERVRPPCPHAKRCGGCSLQHAADAFVADWKVDRVRSALAAHDIAAPIRNLHTSPPQTRRRAALSGRRFKKGAEIGFHARQSDQIVPVPDCLVLHPAILEARPHLEAIVARLGSRKGEVRLTVTHTDTGLDVAVSGVRSPDRDNTEALVSIMNGADFARLVVNEEVVGTRRAPTVQMGHAQTAIPSGAFLQATKEGEAALVAGVLDALRPVNGRVADLFAGAGTFALPLASRVSVHAVEGLPTLTGALDLAWRHAKGLRQVTTETRDLFRRPLLPDEISAFAGVVVDPPRAGAEAQVTNIADGKVSHVAMVSCNPITFARDAAILMAAGYRLNWIDVVDQFRWSAHVELVASFDLSTR